MRKILITICFILPFFANAQEFFCNVSVTSPQIQGTEKNVFTNLQKQIQDFVNNRKWTKQVYKTEERIECSISINISERVSSDQFKGRMSIVVRRPVYKTSYYTNLLNLQDKDIDFKYLEFEALNYNDNTFTSNLTSLISYYIYIILGVDADSFSQSGGTAYFEKARDIVNLSQNTPEKGWKSYEGFQNRYWLAENYLNSSYAPMREAMYQYHRLGLDVMADNVEMGRSAINECLENLQKTFRQKPNGIYALQLFMEAKRDEIIQIYKKASPADQGRAIVILKEIDPANSAKYQAIQENK